MCCDCCNPEQNWQDDFSQDYVDRCYVLRRFSREGSETSSSNKFRRPNETDTISSGTYQPHPFLRNPPPSTAQYLQESVMRRYRFYPDADFEINFEVGVENLTDTSEQVNISFGSQTFNFLYWPNVYRMSGPGSSYNWEFLDTFRANLTLRWRIQILGSGSTKYSNMRYYLNGGEHTSWFSGQTSGSNKTYNTTLYNIHRNTPAMHHVDLRFSTLRSNPLTYARLTSFKLTSHKL